MKGLCEVCQEIKDMEIEETVCEDCRLKLKEKEG